MVVHPAFLPDLSVVGQEVRIGCIMHLSVVT